jgi:hypothetical protein
MTATIARAVANRAGDRILRRRMAEAASDAGEAAKSDRPPADAHAVALRLGVDAGTSDMVLD